MLHKNIVKGDRHAPHSFEYTNAAARTSATGIVAADVGKLALQLDDFTLWVLADESPLTWVAIGSSSSSVVTKQNRFLNGRFDVMQRSSVGANGTLIDQWRTTVTGSSIAQSRVAFTLGQTSVPGEPAYYWSCAVTSVNGAGNFALAHQNIEDVRVFAGTTVTVSFYAKADAARSIAVEGYQHFGSGGSPSSAVSAISPTKLNLTTSWTKYSAVLNVPSISGKTIGSNNDSWLGINFWMDSGSNFSSRNSTLGQQNGTFDFALMQIEEGNVATPFEPEPYSVTLAKCQRYFYRAQQPAWRGVCSDPSTAARLGGNHPVPMRASPTITLSASGVVGVYDGSASRLLNTISVNYSTPYVVEIDGTTTASGLTVGNAVTTYQSGSGYFDVSAEL